MILTHHEWWAVIHGLFLGSLYLLAFAGGLDAMWSLRPGLMTEGGVSERLKRLKRGVWLMTITCWLTVISGTYIVYVWYRDPSPTSPRSKLLADPTKAAWHTFAMEWKEHASWMAPILMTAVTFLVVRYGEKLLKREDIRNMVLCLFVIAFAAAAVGGLFGAFINKAAPIF